MTAAETIFAAGIALLAAAGLLLASRALEGRDKRRKQMFCYYTNLSNTAMLLIHALLLIPGRVRAALLSPPARYLAVLCILVTFIIYFFVLTRFGRHSKRDTMESLGTRRAGNILVHYLVPLLTLLEWLTVADKSGLNVTHALIWLLVPLAYLTFVVLRARTGVIIENTGSLWPYGFMDLEKLGLKKWAWSMLATLTCFFALALVLLELARLF